MENTLQFWLMAAVYNQKKNDRAFLLRISKTDVVRAKKRI
jgi:hypothetical protein